MRLLIPSNAAKDLPYSRRLVSLSMTIADRKVFAVRSHLLIAPVPPQISAKERHDEVVGEWLS